MAQANTPLMQRVLDAYGGADRWSQAKTINAVFSAGGLAFTMKRRTAFKHARISMDVHQARASITPIGKLPEISGMLSEAHTCLLDETRHVLKERVDARTQFKDFSAHFFWDDLAMAYFANYAMWNYLTLPALLLRDDIHWTQAGPHQLDAVFPDHLPTHCKHQRFSFCPNTNLLMQHDYTAEVIAQFASAAHRVLEHKQSNGIPYTSKRQVSPRLPSGKALGYPTLIYIDVHEFELI